MCVIQGDQVGLPWWVQGSRITQAQGLSHLPLQPCRGARNDSPELLQLGPCVPPSPHPYQQHFPRVCSSPKRWQPLPNFPQPTKRDSRKSERVSCLGQGCHLALTPQKMGRRLRDPHLGLRVQVGRICRNGHLHCPRLHSDHSHRDPAQSAQGAKCWWDPVPESGHGGGGRGSCTGHPTSMLAGDVMVHPGC